MTNASTNFLTLPVYQRIEAHLRSRIGNGDWLEGAPLPSRAALAKEYGVGLATLERAISALLADGTLTAVPGQYTIISRERGQTRAVSVQPGSEAPVLGIVTYQPISFNEPPGRINGWIHQASLHLEKRFLVDGGVTVLAPLKAGEDEPLRPIEAAISELADQGATAVAILDLNGVFSPGEISKLPEVQRRHSLMLVYISNADSEVAIPHVYYDSPHMGRQAVRHLTERGFRSFAFVSPLTVKWCVDRLGRARAEAASLGLGADAVTPIFGEISHSPVGRDAADIQRDGAYALGLQIFKGGDYPKCIIAANDYAAYGLIDAAREAGIRHGVDFSIIGFDDETESLATGLTTFRPPLEEIGTEAALLLQRLARGENCSLQVRLRSRLIPRASTIRGSVTPAVAAIA